MFWRRLLLVTLSQENNGSAIFLDHENGGIDTFSIEQR